LRMVVFPAASAHAAERMPKTKGAFLSSESIDLERELSSYVPWDNP
jgi:hypothetical protein